MCRNEICPFDIYRTFDFSYISALTMVSTPGEIYSYGTIFIYLAVLYPFGIVIASKLYLPVFEQMGMVSIYKVNTCKCNSHICLYLYGCICVLTFVYLTTHYFEISWNSLECSVNDSRTAFDWAFLRVLVQNFLWWE